jgi:beta-glucanase (GH16 family)
LNHELLEQTMHKKAFWAIATILAGVAAGCTMHIPGMFEDAANKPAPTPPASTPPASAPTPATSPAPGAPNMPATAPAPSSTLPAASSSASDDLQIPETDGYKLVWHDEFNVDGPLNPADWGYEQGFVRNQELQWYQPENAVCKDGYLVIEARKENKPNPRYVTPGAVPTTATGRGRGRGNANGWQNRPTIEVTAASVNTRGKHQWLYGRFEIRAKIDTRSGSWPAFWTLGTQGGWPANGEIDIMEYYRNMVLANIAWAGGAGGAPNANGATWNSVRTPLQSLPSNWSNEFHTWRMDWDAQAIKLFLDDKLVNQQDLSKTINTSTARGAPQNPFTAAPAYIMLNQAIGGQNGGDPTNTEFPVKFYVDYVRVWQKPS